ncbi:hypothetical protein [Nostoc sp. LEGE 12450]|uniref:hypothetical protein n=1 Tax=Nostoc sp. LEGE 12450 TaxID=1828643 RepID=UPI0018800E95|nr:hypothetical protein [Nostoc sp. LEGE 12450]MBE8987792.1 hypothetical protein [Nostoc sp. LEGE 12450]
MAIIATQETINFSFSPLYTEKKNGRFEQLLPEWVIGGYNDQVVSMPNQAGSCP